MDPRVANVLNRHAKRQPSPLIQALEAGNWERVNFCPFGCDIGDLDDLGYCDHLIGFTNATAAEVKNGTAVYEPMTKHIRYRKNEDGERVADEHGRIVQCPMKKTEAGKLVPDLPLIQKGDQLVEITTSSRVYRKTAQAAKKAS